NVKLGRAHLALDGIPNRQLALGDYKLPHLDCRRGRSCRTSAAERPQCRAIPRIELHPAGRGVDLDAVDGPMPSAEVAQLPVDDQSLQRDAVAAAADGDVSSVDLALEGPPRQLPDGDRRVQRRAERAFESRAGNPR